VPGDASRFHYRVLNGGGLGDQLGRAFVNAGDDLLDLGTPVFFLVVACETVICQEVVSAEKRLDLGFRSGELSVAVATPHAVKGVLAHALDIAVRASAHG